MKPLLIALSLLSALSAHALMSLGPWVPQFKGVDHSISTNVPDATFPRMQSVNILRVDLHDPDVQLLHTPPAPSPVPGVRETLSMTTSNFLKANNLQVAVNANFFCCPEYNSEGQSAIVEGLAISQGVVVSAQEGVTSATVFLFATNNQATVVHTNWPATNTTGIYTAVAGLYPVLIGGVNYGASVSNFPGSTPSLHEPQPRTAFGLSQDRRYLYLLIIDGRQNGYSLDATDIETGAWLLLAGAWDGMSMDGGGSVTMVKANAFNNPVDLNRSSYILQSGRERIVGSHLGVYARPLPGFINDVVAAPVETTATITWTTISNSTSQVEYGTTTNLGTFSVLDSNLVTNHSITLTGLTANTRYYFRVISSFDGSPFYATGSLSTVSFTTTTYTPLIQLTNTWKWNTNNLDGSNWKATNFNDASWSSGRGLLYVESSSSVNPKNTPLPPNNGVSMNNFPVFQTYYFRTAFNYTNSLEGATLTFSNFIDDGSVFYLNGVEIQRVLMPGAPTIITNTTVATGFPCGGDATCANVFVISGNLLTNLLIGTNVLAVEVHQGPNPGNFDMVFGSALFGSVTSATISSITITSPTNNQTLPEGVGFAINTAVTGVLLTNVNFYRDGTVLIGSDSSNPYSIVGPAFSQGAHTLTAVLQDSLGRSVTSSVVNITVAPSGLEVGLSGTGTNGFSALPTVLEGWTTANLPGGASTATTGPQVDAAIQAVAASYVSGALPQDSVLPPATFGAARWNSSGLFIQSRPASVMLNLLMLTLRNNTGADVASFNVSYAFGEAVGFQSEEVPGLRVFYSLSGLANSWQPVPPLTTSTPGALTATLTVTNWPAGSIMYLLWGDDNATGSEGGYTIDNFAISNVVPSSPLALPTLQISQSPGGAVTLNWTGSGYTLQGTATLLETNTPWADLPGPVTTSPYSTNNPSGSLFFRLRQ